MKLQFLISAALAGALLTATSLQADSPKNDPAKLTAAKLGSTKNVHQAGNAYTGGQPSPDDFELAKTKGIKYVITLRSKGEIDWDEKSTVEGLGMKFVDLGFRAPEGLTDKVFDTARKTLQKAKPKDGVLLHCASANRVGAVWMAHRVLDQGMSIEDAKADAKAVGLRTAAYEAKAMDYIKRNQPK